MTHGSAQRWPSFHGDSRKISEMAELVRLSVASFIHAYLSTSLPSLQRIKFTADSGHNKLNQNCISSFRTLVNLNGVEIRVKAFSINVNTLWF